MGCCLEHERQQPALPTKRRLTRVGTQLKPGPPKRQGTIAPKRQGTAPPKRMPTALPVSEFTVKPMKNPAELEPFLPVKQLTREVDEKFIIGKELTRSAAGVLHMVVHRATKLPRLLKRVKRGDDQEEMLEAEVKLLAGLDHPNILRSYELLFDEQFCYLQSEVIPGSKLLTVQQLAAYHQEDVVADVLIQLLEALRYCHGESLVHCNISPASVLLFDTVGSASIRVKIIGFGLKRGGPEENLNSMASSILFTAPEALNGRKYIDKSDIWSCGVLLFALLTNELPFRATTKSKFRDILADPRPNFTSQAWSTVSKEAISLLSSMLSAAPSDRPSAEQCLDHPWLKSKSAPVASRKMVTGCLRNLLSFKCAMKQQMRILSIISMHVMTEEEKQPIIRVFRTFDTDGDAKLSKPELATAMKQILAENRAEGAADRVMQTLDLDNNGFLDFSEFLIAASDLSSLLSARSLKVAFDLFDEDKSGSISISEFRTVLKVGEHPEVLDDLIAKVDKNKDGELGLEEFTKLIKLAVGEVVGAKGT